ncbi:hypothetical protein SKAU_G00403190 [Synaphobranchus kaupii]|uniref:Uncharacterized protein n=1 Tax=Synaphobranchus kaupii TaxID=118154 RepID=A0A9Q1IBR7_SYNKA|nr:hypothetical protein SKAU_G00403190 [Synaphobranchus kaupii]
MSWAGWQIRNGAESRDVPENRCAQDARSASGRTGRPRTRSRPDRTTPGDRSGLTEERDKGGPSSGSLSNRTGPSPLCAVRSTTCTPRFTEWLGMHYSSILSSGANSNSEPRLGGGARGGGRRGGGRRFMDSRDIGTPAMKRIAADP